MSNSPRSCADGSGVKRRDRELRQSGPRLERGEIEVPHFEEKLAEGLTQRLGRHISPEGFYSATICNFTHAPDMTALVRRAKVQGVSTALLSNSWGNSYPDHLFDGMFDAVVISGEGPGCASQRNASIDTRSNSSIAATGVCIY